MYEEKNWVEELVSLPNLHIYTMFKIIQVIFIIVYVIYPLLQQDSLTVLKYNTNSSTNLSHHF